MSTIRFIRKTVFKVTQAEFAALAGVTQASVSRWENGVAPTADEMKAIRSAAFEQGIAWNDSLFFDVPADHSDTDESLGAPALSDEAPE